MKLKQTYIAALLSAAVLAGCGGGGGGSNAPANLQLSGVAAKGALIGASVKVHPLKADGSVDLQSVLATTTTGDKGQYTLPAFKMPESGRYVVIVHGGAGAQFRDETTGQMVALSDDKPLTLRALGTASTGDAGTLHVTPFSEMMLAALEANGKIDFQKADQARANMVGLLGFDPREVTPKTLAEAANETDPLKKEQQLRLAVMLSAVSKMANDGVEGCSTGLLAEKTVCVVGKLAAETSLDSYKPGSLGDDLAVAANTVIQQNPAPLGNTSFFVTLDRLNCVATACQPPAADSSTPAVQAAHQFFTDIKTTLLTLFGDGRFGSGAMGLQASKFEAAIKDVAPPVDMTGKAALTLIGGAQGYYNFLNGSGAANYGDLAGAYAGDPSPFINAVGCTIYKDAARTITATQPAEANFLGCSARYRVTIQPNPDGLTATVTHWRHRIALTPRTAGGNVFDYQISAVKTVCTGTAASCTSTALQTGDAASQTGTLTLTRNAASETTGFDINGSLPGTINDRDGSLYNPAGKAVWSIKGNYTEQLSGMVVTQQKITLDGSVSIYEKTSDTTAQSTLALAQGTQVVATPKGLSSLSANLKFTTAGAQMEGALAMTEPTLDKSKTRLVPMKTVFSGALRNKGTSGFADILSGEVSVAVNAAHFGSYDVTLDDSATNRFNSTVGVKGKVAAPGHAAIQVTAALAGYSDGTGATADVTTDFLKADGAKLRSVKLTAPDTGTLLFTEPGTNVSVTVVHGQRLHPVKKDGVEVGVINRDTGIVTFKDGSFISLN